MSCLPEHGRVACTRCYKGQPVEFNRSRRTEGGWRITANPLAWGNPQAEIVVLGFSKGPRQVALLAAGAPHNTIAYKGSRPAVGKILAHLGLLKSNGSDGLAAQVDRIIADRAGRFHFGSLVRCTVERHDQKSADWIGTGSGMLDRFVATSFGQEVASNCVTQFLGDLPAKTRLVLMFGLGRKGNYVREARKLVERARPGAWKTVNEVAYSDGKVMFVHVEHFTVQGAHLSNWLGINSDPRARLGLLARDAVGQALG